MLGPSHTQTHLSFVISILPLSLPPYISVSVLGPPNDPMFTAVPFYTPKGPHAVTLRAFLLCFLKCQQRAADCWAYGSYVEHSYPTGPGICFNPEYLDRRRAPASGPGGCVF